MAASKVGFGPYILDAAANTLVRQGVPVAVSYRGFQLLKLLLSRRGEIVSKSELMEAAWPGTTVEESNLSVQIAALRKVLEPAPDGGEWIVNVPRLGYRFTAPVLVDTAAVAIEPELGPSIAVLPFASLSDDPEQAYFADGLSEDLITRLARLHWLFVASRNASFSYRGMAADPSEVGRRLNIRYVLEGSVRRSGNRIRITSQLSDAPSGLQVWARTFELEIADFFSLQDQISEAVVAAIEPRLFAAEHKRFSSRPPESLDAWGFVMKAMPYVWTWGSPDEIATAQALLGRAIEIDRDYPRANSLLAWTLGAQAQLGLADAAVVLPQGLAMAQQAIQHAPEDPWTHFAAGYVHMVARETDAALSALNTALDLNPSLAVAHMILASTYAFAGMSAEGMYHLAVAEGMSPHDFSESAIYATTAMCHFVNGDYRDAMAFGQRAVKLRPHFGSAWRTFAASSGMAGDLEVGRQALAETRRLHPSLSIDWVERYHPVVRAADRDRYVAGLRSLGLE